MVQTTKKPREVVEQLQETRADIFDLMSLTEAHVMLTGNTQSISAIESAYHHVEDALNNVSEFAESVDGESP
jgi:hypothetical protein